MNITGRCYCGQVKYRFEGEPAAAMQCHCRECQYITGGNPNVFVVVPEEGFTFTEGTPESFARTDIDNPATRIFCGNCGTAIGTRSPRAPGSMVIKVGTMDDPSFFSPMAAIFTKDAQSFHHLPEGLPAFEELPG